MKVPYLTNRPFDLVISRGSSNVDWNLTVHSDGETLELTGLTAEETDRVRSILSMTTNRKRDESANIARVSAIRVRNYVLYYDPTIYRLTKVYSPVPELTPSYSVLNKLDHSISSMLEDRQVHKALKDEA